jgi:hypothetical protein
VRRSQLLVFAAAALAVAVSGAGYLVAANRHRLESGSSSWHGADAQVRELDGVERTELRFAFTPRGQATFGASIRNPGPWPVTINGIAIDDGPADRHVFKIARLAVNHPDEVAMFDPDAAEPFHSVRVAADTELPIFVTFTIPDVTMASGSSVIFSSLGVDYKVLGMSRHQRVPMGFRVSIHSPNGYAPGQSIQPLDWPPPKRYAYTLDSRCGEQLLVGRIRLWVDGDTVVSAEGLDDAGERLADRPLDKLPTLTTLVGYYNDSVASLADLVVLKQDGADGHPVRIEIYDHLGAMDDENCFSTSMITPQAPD